MKEVLQTPTVVDTYKCLIALSPCVVCSATALQIGIDGNVVNLFLTLLLTEIVVAHIVWILEVLNNKSHQFSRQYVTGIALALYFTLITITTVGYGDTVPATPLGKLISIIGLFIGIIITALMTGTIASNINAYRLEASLYQLNNLGDMPEYVHCCVREFYCNWSHNVIVHWWHGHGVIVCSPC